MSPSDRTTVTPASLGAALAAEVVAAVEAFGVVHAPGWRLPRAFAGHEVGADVRADLCFTLTHLAEAGVEEIGGRPIDGLLTHLLAEVDGSSTHTFFSYRIAETLLRRGPFAGNPLIGDLDECQRDELVAAVDSADWLELLDAGVLPRNYAAVLARCEQGRIDLGLETDPTRLDALVERARTMLATRPERTLDDSNDQVGRYDIYTADVWLFCQPLAPRLGELWRDGFGRALDLVRAVGARDGSAIAWGRSVGDLSAALTLEMAALGVAERLDPDHDALWLRRAADAAATVMAGFGPDGVSTAHQHRAQDGYRGPARRLQLTFDLLGKVAWAAQLLLATPPEVAASGPASIGIAYPSDDRWIAFEQERPAGVWAHRGPGADLVLPFVGITRSHYLPVPHQPGTWEAPIDRDLPTWTPLVTAGLSRHTAGGLPVSVDHAPGALTATWDGFPVSGGGLDGDEGPAPLPGRRTARWTVEGRSLVLDDHLTFERPPRSVSVAIPEVEGWPLRVTWECASPHAASVIDVSGLGEWRSATSSFGRVHQIDLDPATELRYRVRATPLLRVATTEPEHHYTAALHEPMAGRVVVSGPPVGWRADGTARLADVDLLHLHWPEWLAFDDLAAHEAIIEQLADADVPVVWTAHNLTPHEKRPEVHDAIYAVWARAVRGVIHHSAWGEAQMRARHPFGPDCVHEVIPHGHFGALWSGAGMPIRAEAEARLGLEPCGVRIGVVGAPRAEKDVQAVLDGVAASGRDDIQLVCWSLGPDDVVPDDPRIAVASPYRSVSPHAYATRLAACDALALVFDPEGEMLATGTAADAIGVGLPVLRSDWGYLVEALGGAGIPVGHRPDTIAAALDALTPEALAAARAAAVALQAETAWADIAVRTEALYERVVLTRPR